MKVGKVTSGFGTVLESFSNLLKIVRICRMQKWKIFSSGRFCWFQMQSK